MRILAVDVSAIFSLYWHAAQGTAQEHSEPYLRTIQAVRKHREGFDRVAICCDSGRSFRAAIWSAYKANRTDRGEAYRAQIRRTVDALGKDGCLVFRGPASETHQGPEGEALYYEADDVIGSLAAWCSEDAHELVIMSSDKDLCQLVGGSVFVRNMTKPDQPDMDAAAVKAKFGVDPARIPDMLALGGDKSDNYKPIAGVGDTGAVKMVATYGNALAVFEEANLAGLHQILGDAMAKKVREAGAEPVRKCLQVATIVRDVDLDFGVILDEPTYETVEMPQPAPAADEAAPAPASPREVAMIAPAAQPVRAVAHSNSAPQLYSSEMPYWAEPSYLERLYRIGEVFKFAGCFPNVSKPEQVMVVAMMAHERGIGLATAMQHAYFVNGKLAWSGAYLSMLVRRSGTCEEIRVIKLDANGCTIRFKRKGQVARDVTFTYQDAVDSGVTQRNAAVWKPYKVQMLFWSCLRTGLRQEWSDIIAGHYMPDELGQVPEEMMLSAMRNDPEMQMAA